MALDFIPPNSKDSVIFEEEEWKEGESIWKLSLIGQVLGINAKFKDMENFIKKAWSPLANPEILLLKSGLFLFRFNSKEEMNDIMENGPWFFGSRPILLKYWTIEEEIEKSFENNYPIWIQLPGLRLNLWNAKCLSKIASVIGKPIATDKLTANRQRLSYARVLVEVKMPSTLPDHISIQGPNGKMINQRVHYEWKPKWCDYCKQLGHDAKSCRKQVRTQKWVPKNPGTKENVQGDLNTLANAGSKNPVNTVFMKSVHDKDHISKGSNQSELKQSEKIPVNTQNVPNVHIAGKCSEYIDNQMQEGQIEIEGLSLFSIEGNPVHVVHSSQTKKHVHVVHVSGANTEKREEVHPEVSWTQIQKGRNNSSLISSNSFSSLAAKISDLDPSTLDRGSKARLK
ncbi:uncharacterized protein LOC109846252 [Asparagus officinalis]|uniref:uncharacterized protein LOC109846252 n=1 Tax=Asparagus officinalis TaxID=4686 RepID=UPI00098E5B34|nr:uncharacterized protein LOC109846252 [Asparagus officinalis]